MLRFSLYLIVTLFLAQLATQDSIKSSYDSAEGTVLAQRNLTGPPAPKGYEYFSGFGYYKLYAEGALSYDVAFQTCVKDGAHLAIINSDAEAEVLKALFALYPDVDGYAYLGFNDIEEEGNFVTIFGDSLSATGYEKWRPGEPTGDGDCGSMYRDGGLNDLTCEYTSPFPFFCEINPLRL